MLIVFHPAATDSERQRVAELLRSLELQFREMDVPPRSLIAVLDGNGRLDPARVSTLPGVDQIIPLGSPYRMVAREWRPEPTIVQLPGGITVGGSDLFVIAGPCSVESPDQIRDTARAVRAAGAVALRGGAFKPRTSPYAFQGLGLEGLELLRQVRRETGLLIVTEAMEESGVEQVAEVADILQVGARNMQNYALLKRVGRAGKPVLLKRGMTASLTDWLMSAEYVLAEGNPNVILCERGIRGQGGSGRALFDINAIAAVKALTHLPVLADPSHATEKRSLVPAAARAAVAAGADGLMIEVHVNPEQALSDGAQTLYPEQFHLLMEELRGIAAAIGRRVAIQ
jgi:3-deoxy-7-phosphoheptulonate synthase